GKVRQVPAELKVWDAFTGKKVLTLEGHTNDVARVAFSPDGKRIASGSGDHDKQGEPLPGEVKVWDAVTGRAIRTLRGHTGRVTSVAFSHDGKRIVSGSDDQTLTVWDLDTGRTRYSFPRMAPQTTSSRKCSSRAALNRLVAML